MQQDAPHNQPTLCTKGREGGRGLIQFKSTNSTRVIVMQKYLETSDDWMLQLLTLHEQGKEGTFHQ